MTDRNPYQNRRSLPIASSRGPPNIQPSGFIEGWRPRHRHYSERIGPTGTPTKILRPKSGTFEVLLRTIDESKEEVQICEPYETPTADLHIAYTPQILKNTFQKPLELTFDDQMYSSSVIGWTEETGNTVLINKTLLGITAEDIVPLTDTIFPVLVMGKYELPVLYESFHRDFLSYEPGFYLVLHYTERVNSFTVQIEVQKGSTPHRVRVPTHQSVLELYNFNVMWNKKDRMYTKMYIDYGHIHRILDKDNPTYGIYGMYAGGPLPPADPRSLRRYRITWDQPRSIGSEDFGLNSMEAGFRYDVDYQRISQRTGFYCSRDALLGVSEKKDLSIEDKEEQKIYYRSLLKECTFVIVDGESNYGMFHSEGNTQWVSFRNPDYPSGPVVVIIPEGISYLRINTRKQNAMHRNSNYFNANSVIPPIVINWRSFQNDFNATSGITQSYATQLRGQVSATARQQQPDYIQQIMNLRDFRDYVVYPINSLGNVYVFCLIEEPKHLVDKKVLSDSWHIYGKLSDQTVEDMSALYYYLGSVSFSYTHKLCSDGQIRVLYSKMFNRLKVFPPEISTQYNITQREEQRAEEMAEQFMFEKIRNNEEFKQIVKHLIEVDSSQLNNLSSIGHSRQQTIDSFKNQSFD